jgi:mannitol-1-phosphate 5-dehydrogenase
MSYTKSKKLLLFGAGKIGRSFIAQLFHRAGYHLVFVDIDEDLTRLLNKHKNYKVVIKGDLEKTLVINNFEALHFYQKEKIISEVAGCDICAVSVGQRGLPGVVKLLTEGLQKRKHRHPGNPLDVILAENLRDAAKWMNEELKKNLPAGFPLDEYVGLVETSIGKMVPIMTRKDIEEDPLQVFAEPYNNLILDGKAFKNQIPEVEGLAPKNNMKAWVDRKLFIHNLGHACLAYLAFLKNPTWNYTWEALNDRELKKQVFSCMQEAANVLMKMHPGEFTQAQLTDHINDLLYRFANKSLGDTIFRVGCDLERKLGPDDRLVPVIKYAIKNKLPFLNIMKAFVSGIFFDARDDEGKPYPPDLTFLHKFNRNVARILIEHCNFEASDENRILFLGMNLENEIKQKLKG